MDTETRKHIHTLQTAVVDLGGKFNKLNIAIADVVKEIKEIKRLREHYQQRVHSLEKQVLHHHTRLGNLES